MAFEDLQSTQEDTQRMVQTELDEAEKSLKEIKLMIEQSQGEVNKLSQRNAAINLHLQQGQGASMSASELKMAYDSALDAQQRLFVMRGQLEKLQSNQEQLTRYKNTLQKVREFMGQGGGGGASSRKTSSSMDGGIEMVINAQESERQRLSRQMHDGPAQALSNFILQAEIAMRLLDSDAAQAREELTALKSAAMGTFQKVRNFISELRPMMLDDLGLSPTIKRYIDTFKEQTGLDATLTVFGLDKRLQPFLEVMIFRALQELLGNAARHSQATSVKVNIDSSDGFVKVSVDDNGKGFDADIINQGNSLGLKLIRDRVEMLGGNFQIDSFIGKGAKVSFSLPTSG